MKKTLLAALLSGSTAWALPENGQVIQGQIQMTQPNANVLQILQSSPTGIINWNSFGIGPQQLVQFLQPNGTSATLNRVIGQEPSQILGQLQANGRILLINPNGILFGPGSVVDCGSFLASTLTLQDQDFLQGRYDLRWDGTSPLRAIVNQGEIRVADGGFLALVSPLLDNQGVLVAERGQVVLGATRQASLTVDARGLLQVTIPDGFKGTPQESGAVLLTPGQMSDTLAQVVQHYAGSEANAIVDTGHGIQLTGGEGLLVQQGTIRADATQGNAGSILLNSSQATVLTPGSLTSASSQNGNGGEIHVLSADYTRQQGTLQANSQGAGNGGFIEVSAPHVAMTRAVDVSAVQGTAGVFLLDPVNVFIRNGGSDPANQPASTPGDIDVDPSALNVTGSVFLEATRSIEFDSGVQVNLDGATNLRLTADEFIRMNPGSAINATDAAATILMQAPTVDLTTVKAATTHIESQDLVRFNGGVLGLAGSPSLVNISAPKVSFEPGSVTRFEGTRTNFNSLGNGDFVVGTNASLDLAGTSGNNVTVDAGGVGLNSGSLLTATGTNNDLNFAASSGVFNQVAGSTISAPGAGSVVNITANQAVDLATLEVPTVKAQAGTFARFNGGQVGVAGQASNVNVTASDVLFKAGSTTDFVGTDVNVTLTASQDVNLEANSRWNLNGSSSNLANVTTTGTGVINLQNNAAMIGTGPFSDLIFNAGGAYSMDPGASVQGEHLTINALGNIDLQGNLSVDRLDAESGGYTRFLGGTLGRGGPIALANVISHDGIYFFAGTTLNVLADNTELALLALHNTLAFGDGSTLQMSGQTSNVLIAQSVDDLIYIGENARINTAGLAQVLLNTDNTILQRNGSAINIDGPGLIQMNAGVNVVVQATSSMNVTSTTFTNGATSQFEVHAQNDALLDGNANLATANVTADRNLQMQGTWGRDGSPTRIDGTGANVTLFTTNVKGSQVDWTLNATTGALIEAAGSTIRVEGANNHLNWKSQTNTEMGENSILTAPGPTQLNMQAGGRFLQFNNSTVTLADQGSNFTLNTGGSPALSRVEVGGRLAVTASGGNNVRIANQVIANDVVITTPGQLLDDRTDNVPAIIAHNSLNVTVANVSGPLTDPNIGLVNALPFATGPNAQVRFNLTGPNNTTLGNRSANLYYAYPQSGDVQITHPNSDVALYNEPAPPVADSGIATRHDLSPAAFQEITSQSAQAQVQLSSLYSVADLPATDNVLLLQYDNAGLTEAYSLSHMTSALIERIVLSLEEAVKTRREREKREVERPENLIVANDDEDEQILYWRRLIEGILIWEE